MNIGKKRFRYRTCPQCGERNRSSFHCCHHCGYVFPKTSGKLKLTTAEIGMIVGAVFGLVGGLLLWDVLRLFGVISLFFGGGLLGYSLCSGPKANVRSAFTGLVVGAILGILGLIIQGGSVGLVEIAAALSSLPLSGALAWKGMFMGTRAIRTGGVVGALGGVIAAIVMMVTRNNDIGVGMALVAMCGFAFLGVITGMGVVYKPWFVLVLGIVLGVASWVGWQFDPAPIIELPKHLVGGLIKAGGFVGFQRVAFD